MTEAQDRPAITPVFVLGANRNGTTWLCNLLGCHREIAGLHHPLHHGAKECPLLAARRFAGGLSSDERLVPFMELFSAADMFRLARGDKSYFYQNPPADFYELFLEMMDQFAIREGASFWTVKLDPQLVYYPQELRRFLGLVDDRYREVRFVSIQRDYRKAMNSYLGLHAGKHGSKLSLASQMMTCFRYAGTHAIQYRVFRNIIRESGGLMIWYEDMKADVPGAMKRICEHIGVDFYHGVTGIPYKPNTTAKHRYSRAAMIRAWIAVCSALFHRLFALTPRWAMRFVALHHQKPSWDSMPFHFRLTRMEKMPEQFGDKLRASNERLYEEVFEAVEDSGSVVNKDKPGGEH